jgi:hypothetical protein
MKLDDQLGVQRICDLLQRLHGRIRVGMLKLGDGLLGDAGPSGQLSLGESRIGARPDETQPRAEHRGQLYPLHPASLGRARSRARARRNPPRLQFGLEPSGERLDQVLAQVLAAIGLRLTARTVRKRCRLEALLFTT